MGRFTANTAIKQILKCKLKPNPSSFLKVGKDPLYLSHKAQDSRGQRDFRVWDRDWNLGGLVLKAWDQYIQSYVSDSMFETTNQKSQYQSHCLRQKTKSLSLSVKDEIGLENSPSWSQQKCWSYFFHKYFLEVLNIHFRANIFSKSRISRSQV